MLSLIRWLTVSCALVLGIGTTRVAVLTSICPGSPPDATVVAPTVQSPVLLGVVSGLTLGAWPESGYGKPEACIDGDVGVGMPIASFQSIRMNAAWAWAAGRGVGFALSVWLLWWAASWLWRAARSLFAKSPS